MRRYKCSKSLISKKGTIDILIELKDGQKTFTNLKELKLSPNTIVKRLREMQKAGLVEPVLTSSGKTRRMRIEYKLTKEGERAIKNMEKVLMEYKRLKKKLDQMSKEQEKILRKMRSLFEFK